MDYKIVLSSYHFQALSAHTFRYIGYIREMIIMPRILVVFMESKSTIPDPVRTVMGLTGKVANSPIVRGSASASGGPRPMLSNGPAAKETMLNALTK